MPLPLVGALGGVIAGVGAALVGRLLLSLGIGIITFIGVGELMDNTLSTIEGQYSLLPAQMSQVIGLMKIDDGIRVVFAAIAVRVTLFLSKKVAFGRSA